MSVTSNRKITIAFTGDVEYTQEFDAPVNSAGSGQIQVINLASGANTITVPTGAVAVTIIPPDNNSETLTLKGLTGDTGIALALTAPCSLSLAGVTTFVLTAGGTVTGVRFIYS